MIENKRKANGKGITLEYVKICTRIQHIKTKSTTLEKKMENVEITTIKINNIYSQHWDTEKKGNDNNKMI